jgi:drug/metabolite transporter (DMT)-like permease
LIGSQAHHGPEKKKKMTAFHMLIPTSLDIFENLFSNIALTLIAASIAQMLRATLIIFTAVFSVTILKMKLYKHHYFSLLLIIIGLVLVGLAPIIYSNAEEKEESGQGGNMLLGVTILLTGQVFGSLGYIFEEKFMSEFDEVHPYIVVGYEGFWGTILNTIMLLAFQFIPC